MFGVGMELLCLAGDFAAVAIFYRLYKQCQETVLQIKTAPSISCGSELDKLLEKNEGMIGYCCLKGVVSPAGRALKSQYDHDVTGVIQKLVMVEHKSKRTQGFWADVKKILRNTVNTVPFFLSLPTTPDSRASKSHNVYVMDPTSADMLLDNLRETHDKFESQSSSLLSRGLDRLFGDVTQGIQETEHMLPVGATLLGLGKVVADSSKVRLLPPTSGARYILTPLSKREVLKRLESKSTIYKILVGVFGVVGVVIFVWWSRKLLKTWKEQREIARQELEIEQARLHRISQQRRTSSADEESQNESARNSERNEASKCVICLTEDREVIILNCGHICVCTNCAQALTLPRKCPICRAIVDRILPVYNV